MSFRDYLLSPLPGGPGGGLANPLPRGGHGGPLAGGAGGPLPRGRGGGGAMTGPRALGTGGTTKFLGVE